MVLQRESMRDRVKQVLLDRILDGTYKPGDRLVELQIARELDTSQAPVREALRELEVMRLVESETYRGTRVREVSLRELKESYQVRGELEALAARLAASSFYENPQPLLDVHTEFKAVAEAKDIEKFTKYNHTFHRLIVETSDNRVLLEVWDSLILEVWTRINLSLVKQHKFDWQAPVKEHQEIVDAFCNGLGETAAKLLRQHSENVIS